jgi:hypothetical protein
MAQFVNEKILDRLSIEYEPPEQKFISDEVLTRVPVVLEAGKYAIFQKFGSKIVDDLVGVKSETGRLEIGRMKTDGTYAVQEHGLKDLVTAKEAKVYADFTDLGADTVYGLKKALLINREKLVADLVNGSANFYNPNPKWDAANCIIEQNIRDAITEFETLCGRRPNVFVMPNQVWDVVNMDSTLREIWKLVPARADQNIKLSSLLALLFDNFETILIPNSKYDTAKKGKTEVLDYIWTDNCALLYVKRGQGTPKTFTWGSKFLKSDWKTKQWENTDPEGTWFKLSREDDVREVCSVACYLLKDCLT